MGKPAELDDFLIRLSDLDEGELLRLTAVHRAIDPSALEAARVAAQVAADRSGNSPTIRKLDDEILRWAESHGAVSGIWAGMGQASGLMLVDLRRQAVPMLVDIATALLLGEQLDPASSGVLLEAWTSLGETAEDRQRVRGRIRREG